MSGPSAVSWLLIGLAVIDWLATVILVRAALQLDEPALQERASTSVILSVGASLAAVLAGAFLLGVILADGVAFLFLCAGLVILSAPQLLWVLAYWRGKFR